MSRRRIKGEGENKNKNNNHKNKKTGNHDDDSKPLMKNKENAAIKRHQSPVTISRLTKDRHLHQEAACFVPLITPPRKSWSVPRAASHMAKASCGWHTNHTQGECTCLLLPTPMLTVPRCNLLPTYLPAYLPTYLPTYLPACLPTYLPT